MSEKTIHILLVEDSESHAEKIREALGTGPRPVNLTVARSLAEARAGLAEVKPDLALIDLLLPDGSGSELLPTDLSEALYPAVIMISQGDEQAAVEPMKAGVLDYVVKSAATLADMVRIVERNLREWNQITARRRAEETLKRSEKFSQTLLDSMNGCLSIINVNDFRIVDINGMFLEEFGFAKEEVIGKTCHEITHALPYPCTPPDHVCPLLDTATTGQHSQVEHVHYDKEGEAKYVEVSTSPIKDEDGTVVQVVHIARDISERKRAEVALRESEERFRSFFASAASGMAIISPEGKALKVNPTLCRLSGYSEAEALQKSVFEVTHPEDREEARRHYDDIRAGRRKVVDYEKRYLRKDGSVVWGRTTVAGVFGPNKELLYYAANVQDITERKQAEEALRESEARFRSLFESAAAGMFTISPEGRFLKVNKALCGFLGYPQNDLLKLTVDDVTHPGDRKRTAENYRNLFSGLCQGFNYEKRFLRGDGRTIWGHSSVASVPGVDLKPMYYVGLVQDITERRQAEDELRDSEDRFRAIFDQAAVGVAQVTPAGHLLRVNKKFCDIVGYSREEIQKRTFQDITHPDDVDADVEYVRQMLDGEIQTYAMEKRYIRKDGTLVWVNLTVALRRDPEGNPNYFISVVEDISQRKQAEEALRKSEASIKAIFNNVAAGIEVLDAEGRLVDVNDRLAGMLGYAKDELIGKSPVEFAHPEDRQKSQTMLKKALDGQLDAYRLEKRCVRKDDSVFWGDLSFTRVVDEKGEVEADIGIVFDVTERKTIEERLKAANRELEAFVYTVSHDLRTPLTPIIGFADLLKETYQDRLDEQGLDCLTEIRTAGERMLGLLEDLLALAQVGHLERPSEPVDSGEVVREVLEHLSSRIASVGATVQTGSLPTLHVPETLLSQIFDNLISNALRYGVKKGGTIEVGGERREGRILFFVRDHGPGIPKRERESIFDVFFRGQTGKRFKGTGVGLATVQKIAHLYRGQAWVEETPGGGSTFWVEMLDVPTITGGPP